MHFLIVKTSSLGDILQAFGALAYLRGLHPEAAIDWVAEERFKNLLEAHPFIRRALALDLQGLKKSWWRLSYWIRLVRAVAVLRKARYDAVFDLQGNAKSGLVTMLAKSPVKVGFGAKSVREWPNLLATNVRFEVPKSLPVRLFYARLLQQFFRDTSPIAWEGVRFRIAQQDQRSVTALLSFAGSRKRMMVCPGSRWKNKQMPALLFAQFLQKVQQREDCFFFLIWGTAQEKTVCEEMRAALGGKCFIADPLPFPAWQNFMAECDLVIAVDSGGAAPMRHDLDALLQRFWPHRFRLI